ncbi:flagellar basal body-associated FliL family protein [Aurantiacibacter luteus]|uniref:Flagellar protein FliL n=1 Tax=Aurantiacibacter luteus TaxID=1581420 RepID=A0A0G9MKQ7_9SPHN|nr:flagellar basal body-associated FliL family protein [Aurantiacibacter luteus]KLE31267.1 flagellar basal body-associated protein FliL [Aurantiacibacter luteus]
MSETPEPKKKSGGKLKLLVGALLLLGLGAGGVYGAMHFGLLGGAAEARAPEGPQLLPKGEDDPYAPTEDESEEVSYVDGEGGSEYRTSYYSFEDSFTANLKNSAALIQVSLAASTRRDGRVLQWLHRHELAIRSAIIVQLAETTEEQATTEAGKQDLQRRLTAAINEVLENTEGFGGVDNVYYRGYLVQ